MPSTKIRADENLLDSMERYRTGANTHYISNLRQSYIGAMELAVLYTRKGERGECATALAMLEDTERRIRRFVADAERQAWLLSGGRPPR